MSIIVIGGLDATGQAGLARDIAVCQRYATHAAPVATMITADDSPVTITPPAALADALESAWQARRPHWIKVGAIADAEQAQIIADFATQHNLGIVHDPVLGPSRGGAFCTAEDLAPLLEAASLVTPNEDEAAALGLSDGAGIHITRGGGIPGEHRGTGCRFATRVTCLLAQRMPAEQAIVEAHRDLEREIWHDAQEQSIITDPARMRHLAASRRLLWQVLAELRFEHIPEVGLNFAYTMPGAKDPRKDVCGLAGRITIAGFDRDWTGRVAFGGPHHTGRIAVVLQEYDPDARIVMNHRFDEAFLDAARAGGLTEVGFRREDEPEDAPSSMEWGLRDCIRRHGSVPDLVWDRGGIGKEAMIRIIARDPDDLVQKLRRLHAVTAPIVDPDGRPAAPSTP